jgi:copper chaperone CopZ
MTWLVVAVLVVIAIVAFFASKKHMKGEGGCCSGGPSNVDTSVPDKELSDPVLGTKTIKIEGMHCNHCSDSVKRAINRIDGASAQVDYKTGEAKVQLSKEVSDTALSIAVENLGYKVISIC